MSVRIALLLITVASVGCRQSAGRGATDARSDRGEVGAAACTDAQAAPTDAACQGTVEASGATPVGPFRASSVSIQTTCSTVQVVLFDGCSGSSLTLVIPWATDAGAGQWSVRSSLAQPNNPFVTVTTANIDLSEVGAAPVGGVSAGRWTGTFALQQDGFSLSGSFSSATCGSQCQK